ncbi:hypothetical protein [Aneurinibacillus aneurinilyticus]|uniref:hypothetical protein n=1 Tax=Aneurinibacillus aneurinilyticus TaxID=1391 RepID=UPI003523E20D
MKKRLVAAIVAVSVIVGGNCVSAAPVQPKAVKTYTENDIQTIKLYSKIAHEYQMVELLNRMTNDFSNSLHDIYDGIQNGGADALQSLQQFEKEKARIKEVVLMYNDKQKEIQELMKLAQSKKINMQDMNIAMQNCYDAIQQYQKAFQALDRLLDNQTSENFNQFRSLLNSAFDKSLAGRKAAFDGYTKFYTAIQKY